MLAQEYPVTVACEVLHHRTYPRGYGWTVAVEKETDKHTESDEHHPLPERATRCDRPTLERQMQQILFELQQQRALFFLHQL